MIYRNNRKTLFKKSIRILKADYKFMTISLSVLADQVGTGNVQPYSYGIQYFLPFPIVVEQL